VYNCTFITKCSSVILCLVYRYWRNCISSCYSQLTNKAKPEGRALGRERRRICYRHNKLGHETAAEQKWLQPLLESLQRWCWSDVKWQTVPDTRNSSRKRPITDGGQPCWRYHQCRRIRSQSLPWTDVGYTSKLVTLTDKSWRADWLFKPTLAK